MEEEGRRKGIKDWGEKGSIGGEGGDRERRNEAE